MFFVFFFCIFIELVVLIQRNSALRNEALAYLISELVTCLDAVCFSLLVEEAAINYGCRKRQNLGRNLKQGLIKHKSSNLADKIKSKPVCAYSLATLEYQEFIFPLYLNNTMPNRM